MIERRSFLGLVLAAAFAPPVKAATLDSPGQLDRERALLKVLARPEMRAAIGRVERLYAGDAQARTPAGQARLALAAQSIAVSAINYALGEDITRPAVVWSVNAPHRWHGMKVPGSGFGIENPDNIYQGVTVDGSARYLLHGRVPNPGPIQLHLEVRDSIPGLGEMLVEGGRQLATLQTEQLHIAPDGTFTISVDADPVAGRTNHLEIPAVGTFGIGIRQLLTDWKSQPPIALSIERLGQPVSPMQRDYRRLAERAAQILDQIAPYWLAYNNRYIFAKPANRIDTPRQRPGGRGFSTACHYALGLDEALVITVDALEARSLGIQIADPWGVAYEYTAHTSSLNQIQAERDQAGTFSFVISARDPGVANWLDGGGHPSGIAVLRWQGLPAGAKGAKALRSVQVVKLDQLDAVLPPGQSRLTAAQHKRQRWIRARDYAVRLQR